MQKPRNIFLNRAGVTALFLLIAVVAVFSREAVIPPAHAQARAQGVAIRSKADQADIARIEAYLNTIRTMKSRFLQVSSDGDYSEGTLYFSKLRGIQASINSFHRPGGRSYKHSDQP